MNYKGYKIEKRSKDPFNGNECNFCWNVNKDNKNLRFDTLQEAKKWINNQH